MSAASLRSKLEEIQYYAQQEEAERRDGRAPGNARSAAQVVDMLIDSLVDEVANG